MQTPLIVNQPSLSANAAPAARQGSSAPAEAPFNQMLSREMHERQNAQESASAASNETSKNTPAKQPQPAANKAESDANKVNKPDKTDNTDDAQDAGASDAAAAGTAPADMLALVANLTQAAAPLDDAKALPADAAKALPATLALQGAAGKEKSIAGAEAPPPTAPEAKPAADKTGVDTADFARMIGNAKDAASETTSDISKSGKAKEALPDLETAGKNKVAASDAPIAGKKQDAMPDLSAGKVKEAAPDLAGALKSKEALPAPSAPVTAPVAQASLSLAQTVAAQPTEKLSPPVGTPAWDQALGQKVVWMVAGGQQSATMTLNPPDLGPMQVVLNVNNDQATATFTSAQPEVRQALEAAMPKLREMMSDAGIQLGSATVSTGMPNHQNNNAPNDQPRSNVSRFDQAGGSIDLPLRTTNANVASGGQGLVDTFA